MSEARRLIVNPESPDAIIVKIAGGSLVTKQRKWVADQVERSIRSAGKVVRRYSTPDPEEIVTDDGIDVVILEVTDG